MESLFIVSGVICSIIGLIGCFVSVLPGPMLGFVSLLLLLPTRFAPSSCTLVLAGVIVAVIWCLDYIIPAIGAKVFKCSRWGIVLCFVGTLIGLFFLPVGIFLGPFIGALCGEIIVGKRVGPALFGSIGAALGVLSGMLFNFAAWIMTATIFVMCLFKI